MNRRFRMYSACVAIAIIATFLSACGSSDDSTDLTNSASADLLRRTLQHDGIEREYFVHVPVNVGESPPLIIAIHGYTSTATGFQKAYDLNAHSDRHGYVIVYPQGSHFPVAGQGGNTFLITSWNDLAANGPPQDAGPHCTNDADTYACPPECGTCDRCDWTSCNDDLGFLTRLLDSAQAEFATDPDRIYVLGVSNGAMMALQLGCRLSDRIAAIVPIIGQLAPGYACGPDNATPLLHLFGQRDQTVRYDGQPGADGYRYTSASDTAAIWANALSCSRAPRQWETENSSSIGLQCTAWSDCAVSGHEVVSCMDPQGQHDWPGQRVAGMPATCITENQRESMPDKPLCPPSPSQIQHTGMDLIWAFMRQYRLENGQ